jgi:hypothetical protein
MLSRKMSAPSAINRRSVSGFSVAGPSVQMIFVFRIASTMRVASRNARRVYCAKKTRRANQDAPRRNQTGT